MWFADCLSMLQDFRKSCRQNNRRCWPILCWASCHSHRNGNGMLLYVDLFASGQQLTSFRFPVEVIAPELSFPIITIPICLLIALNLLMHYFYACSVPPGFVEDRTRQLGSGVFWARKKGERLTDDVEWSSQVNITKAEVTQCSKCGQTRPEVCLAIL
jgi:hypothetical protein